MARWFILTLSRLSYVKIIGQSLQLREEDVAKEVGATSSDGFLFSLICGYGPRGNTLTVRRFLSVRYNDFCFRWYYRLTDEDNVSCVWIWLAEKLHRKTRNHPGATQSRRQQIG